MTPPERPPEKANYSYKEMMERLKRERRSESGGGSGGGGSRSRRSGGQSTSGGGSGGGGAPVDLSGGSRTTTSQPVRREIVERPDGSREEVEVRRRRKRRTHQPKKAKAERMRKFRRGLVVIGVPVLVIIIGLYFLMLNRIKSEGYRLAAGERVSELAGADIEFGAFKMRGLEFYSRKAVLGDVPDTFIRGGEAVALKGKTGFGSLISSDWSLGIIQASNSTFRFGPATGRSGFAANRPAVNVGPALVSAGFGMDRKPGAINAEGIQLGLTDLIWEGGAPGAAKFVDGTSLTTGRPGKNPLTLMLTGGKLAVPTWPDFRITRIAGSASPDVFTIQSSTLDHGKMGGLAKLTGTVGYTGAGPYNLDVVFKDIETRDILPPYWADHLGGELDGELSIKGSLADPSTIQASGSFTSRKFVLSSHRMVLSLAHELGEALLQHVEFRSFSGRYRRDGEKTEFLDIVGTHPSLLQLRGNATAFLDGRLDARFQIGIPETILGKIEGGRPGVFGEPIDGFCWTTVAINGLVDDPRDDLTPKLEALRKRVEEQKRRTLPPVLRPEGGTPPADAGDAFEKLIKPN